MPKLIHNKFTVSDEQLDEFTAKYHEGIDKITRLFLSLGVKDDRIVQAMDLLDEVAQDWVGYGLGDDEEDEDLEEDNEEN